MLKLKVCFIHPRRREWRSEYPFSNQLCSTSKKNLSIPSFHFNFFKWIAIKFTFQIEVSSTPGVDFINVLPAVFVHTDPKSAKRPTTWLSFFALLGSIQRKSAHRMLVKLTPGVSNFFTSVDFLKIFWPITLPIGDILAVFKTFRI